MNKMSIRFELEITKYLVVKQRIISVCLDHELTVLVILKAFNGSNYDLLFLLSEITNDTRFKIH